jgi:DNA-binding GntR family transcriptional regulator
MTNVAKDKVFQALKERILSGDLTSDDPLKERDLAKEFGVSRTPIREALRQLVSEKLVRIVPNVGAFVGRFSWADAAEIFTIRKVLEAYAAQLTSGRLIVSQIKLLEALLTTSAAAVRRGDVALYAECDEKFHAILNENCGNQHLVEMIRNVNDKTKLTRLRLSLFQNHENTRQSLKEHRAILKELKTRNATACGHLVWQHGQRFYAKVLQTDQPPAFIE